MRTAARARVVGVRSGELAAVVVVVCGEDGEGGGCGAAGGGSVPLFAEEGGGLLGGRKGHGMPAVWTGGIAQVVERGCDSSADQRNSARRQ